MTSLIKLASETPRGPARRKLLLAAVAAGISFTKVKAAQPTFVLRALLPMSGVTSQTAEATARHLSLSTREVKAAFPRAVLKVAVRFHSGAFSSLIEFPGADPLLVQKFMSERFEEDLYSTTAVSLSAATTVDTVPAGSLALSWTSDGDVVLHGERPFKGAIGAKGFIAAIQETENLLDSLKSIYQKHTAAHVAHPFSLNLTGLTFWTSAKRKSFASPGEFTGFLNDVRDLAAPGYGMDFPEAMVQKHLKGIESERARDLAQKAKWAEHGFSSVETLQNNLNARGNGASSYKVTPLPGAVITKEEVLKFFKGTYTPECGDTLNASPAPDGTWGVYITHWSCE